MKKFVIMCLFCGLFLSGCGNSSYMQSSYVLDKELSHAIDLKCYDKAVEAIENGANISKFSSKMLFERTSHNRLISSPVLISLWHGAYDIAEYLISCGADVNYTDDSGESLLQYCAESYPKIIECVIEAGADLNYVDKDGKTALDYSVVYDVNNAREKAFDILIEHGAVPTDKTISIILENIDVNRYGMLKTCLSYVNSDNIDDIAKKVFSGECISSNDIQQEFIVGGIAAFGCWECMKKQIKYLDHDDIQELLKAAVMYNNKDVVIGIIDEYQQLELDEQFDYLYYACENNDAETVDIILNTFGGNVPIAMSRAIALHNNDVIDYFICNNVDLSKPVLEGTLLSSCCIYNNFEAAEKLLKNGVMPDDLAVTSACRYGNFDLLKLFVENGGDANCKNIYPDGSGGYSALMEAISAGYLDCVEFLIENGADIYHEYCGQNVVDLAQTASSKRIFSYLKSKTQEGGSVVSND